MSSQIFSKSVATGLKKYSEDARYSETLKGCEATIQFTQRMNDLFDILNTHQKSKSLTIENASKTYEV